MFFLVCVSLWKSISKSYWLWKRIHLAFYWASRVVENWISLDKLLLAI